jgi:transcriptional regulator with XRE-family HTH domain
MPEFRERLNQLLMDFREEDSKRTIGDFAVFLDTSRQSLGYYLNGQRIPDAAMIRSISERCSVSADWLLGLSDVKQPDTDLKAVCNYTWPLSERSVRYLHGVDGWKDETACNTINTINVLLETDAGNDLLIALFEYWASDFSKNPSDGKDSIPVQARNKKDILYYSFPYKALQFAALERIKDMIRDIQGKIESGEIGGFDDAES